MPKVKSQSVKATPGKPIARPQVVANLVKGQSHKTVKVVEHVKRARKPKRDHHKSGHPKHNHPGAVHGHGGYWGDFGRSLGGTVGGIADGVISVGKAITGLGSYKVKENSLHIGESGAPPKVVNTKYSSIVRHQEYIGEVVSTTGFGITQYPINPGLPGSMPWLAPQAACYEQYRIRGMIFEFRPEAGDAISSTNNTMGSVILATEYNVYLPAFPDKSSMENHEYTSPGLPSQLIIHPIECARGKTPITELYVRSSNPSQSSTSQFNKMFYDWGNFYVATNGMQQAGLSIGELWVSYEIEFFKPAISTNTSANVAQHLYYDASLGGAMPTSGSFLSNMRDRSTSVLFPTGTNGLTLNPGRFILMAIVQSSTGAATTQPLLSITNGTTVPLFACDRISGINATPTFQAPSSGVSSLQNIMVWGVQMNATGVVTFGSYTQYSSITFQDLWVLPVGSGLSDPGQSRRAVDWDPIAMLSRRLDVMMTKLDCLKEEEDEKHFDSQCSTPVQVSRGDDISQSTVDLAQSLLSRFGRVGSVTSKTPALPAQ